MANSIYSKAGNEVVLLLGGLSMLMPAINAQFITSPGIFPLQQQTVFTSFDLFKNSGFAPCTVNANVTADPTDPRFIVTRDVSTQTDFCSFLAGTPIMIPTFPTQTAFFPWWPTHLVQGVTLLFSYFGLFWTLRTMDRRRMLEGRKVPLLFWLQLPLDIARIAAFLFKAIHGFINPNRFAWINVTLWLLPVNYLFITGLMFRKTIAIEIGSDKFGSFESSVYRTRSKRGILFWAWAILSFGLWGVSLTTMVLHWKWTFSGAAFSRTYVELPAAVANPNLLGTMPLQCLSFLQSGLLESSGFFRQNVDQLTFSLITTLQFVFISVVLVVVYFSRRSLPFDRAYRVLEVSALATGLVLLIPAVAAGLDVIVKVLVQKRVFSLRFTNNLSVTGGCTFAFINMNKKFGYWNVGNELAFRIVMSFLGAS